MTGPDRLFDVAATGERWTGSRALVPLPAGVCPDCGEPFRALSVAEPTLFRHGGHGATRQTTLDHCPCGYRLVRQIQEVNPRHG